MFDIIGRSERGVKGVRAILAVAHAILVIIYPVLHRHTTYQELEGDYFGQRDRTAVAKRASAVWSNWATRLPFRRLTR